MKPSVDSAQVARFGLVEALLIVGTLGFMTWVGIILNKAALERLQADALVEAFVATRQDLAMGEKPELIQERLAQRTEPLFKKTAWSVESKGQEDWMVEVEMPHNEQVCFQVATHLKSLFHQNHLSFNGQAADVKAMNQACLAEQKVKIALSSQIP